MTSKVYKFGIFNTNKSFVDELKEQLFQANTIYNQFISVEKQDIVNWRELCKTYIPGLAEAEENFENLKLKLKEEETDKKLKTAEKALKKLNQTKQHDQINLQKEIIKNIKAQFNLEGTFKLLKDAKDTLKPLRKKYKEIIKADEEALKQIKQKACASVINPKTNTPCTLEEWQSTKLLGPNSSARQDIDKALKELLNEATHIHEFSKYNALSELIKKEKSKTVYNYKSYVFPSGNEITINLSPDTRKSRQDSAEKARETTQKGLRGKPFDFSGTISNQIGSKGIHISDIFEGKCNQIKIEMCNPSKDYSFVNDNRWSKDGKYKNPKRNGNAKVYFQIGVGKNTKYLECNVRIHRKPPEDTLVKYATIKATRIGPNVKFDLLLSLEGNSLTKESSGQGICACDIGWRQINNTLSAGCIGNENEQEIIELPEKIVSGLKHVDSLKSIRDKLFDEAKENFSKCKDILTDIHADSKASYIYKTRSPKKLVNLLLKYINTDYKDLWKEWKSYCKTNELDLYVTKDDLFKWLVSNNIQDESERYKIYFVWWMIKNRHLYTYETSLRKKLLNRRKDFYRNIAAKYAKKYKYLILEDFDLSSVATETETDNGKGRISKKINSNRYIVTVSELREALTDAFGKVNVKKINPAYTSSKCSTCHSKMENDGSEILHCEKCNKDWHRDINAVINMCSEKWDSNNLEKYISDARD